jgi:ribosomal protein S18 acetylase RimI-like enzyme
VSTRVFVRRATNHDLARIVAFRLALLDEHSDNPLYGRLHPDAEARAWDLYRGQLASPHEAMLVAERGGAIVGLLRCVDTPGSPLLLPERYCYISSVYVERAHRRRGVLRALIEGAVAWSTERGLDEMRLHNSALAPMVDAVWQSLGFDVVEHVRRRTISSAANAPIAAESLVAAEAR